MVSFLSKTLSTALIIISTNLPLFSQSPSLFCDASSFNEPHAHTGVVSPFQPGDPKITLDQKATAVLNSGKPYQTQTTAGETGGRGLVVQDIHADTSIVWGRILDYDNYANMVPKTISSSNYRIEKNPKGGGKQHSQTIYTRMTVGFPMLKLEFFIKHLHFPDLDSLTWTLDYSKNSDFNDSCGYWYVIPHPQKTGWTRVFYSVEVSMYDWVPKFVMDFMSSKALTDATNWLKKYSEIEAAKNPSPSTSGNVSNEPDVKVVEDKKVRKFLHKLFHHDIYEVGGGKEKRRVIDDAQEEDGNNIRVIHVSWIRLFLIISCILLVIFNIYLFSTMTAKTKIS